MVKMYKNVIITGASRGVGRETARLLIKKGYKLGLVGRDFDQDYNATLYECDLKKSDEVIELCKKIKKDFSSIDVLVNNAGFNTRKANVEDFDIDEYNEIIDLNLKAPYFMVHELVPVMKRQRQGKIINVVAAMAYLCKENWAPYASAKAGLLAFSRVLSKECTPYNIQVSSLIPGGINTSFRGEEKPEYMSPKSVAGIILQIIESPKDLVVHEIIIKPLKEKL